MFSFFFIFLFIIDKAFCFWLVVVFIEKEQIQTHNVTKELTDKIKQLEEKLNKTHLDSLSQQKIITDLEKKLINMEQEQLQKASSSSDVNVKKEFVAQLEMVQLEVSNRLERSRTSTERRWNNIEKKFEKLFTKLSDRIDNVSKQVTNNKKNLEKKLTKLQSTQNQLKIKNNELLLAHEKRLDNSLDELRASQQREDNVDQLEKRLETQFQDKLDRVISELQQLENRSLKGNWLPTQTNKSQYYNNDSNPVANLQNTTCENINHLQETLLTQLDFAARSISDKSQGKINEPLTGKRNDQNNTYSGEDTHYNAISQASTVIVSQPKELESQLATTDFAPESMFDWLENDLVELTPDDDESSPSSLRFVLNSTTKRNRMAAMSPSEAKKFNNAVSHGLEQKSSPRNLSHCFASPDGVRKKRRVTSPPRTKTPAGSPAGSYEIIQTRSRRRLNEK